MKHKERVVIFVISLAVTEILSQGCKVSINKDLGRRAPLILTTNDEFYLPNGNNLDAQYKPDEIYLYNGETIKVACPKSNVTLDGASTGESIGHAICSNNAFKITRTKIPFASIACASSPKSVARETGKTCLGNFKEIEIGFELPKNIFLRQILICFDISKQNTLYSMFDLLKTVGRGHQKNVPRPNFRLQKYINNVKYYYDKNRKTEDRSTQRETINNLLGLPLDSSKYIGTNYFIRGHLTAQTDFLYGSQQKATFYYINAFPQWNKLNSGIWKSLESQIRKFAANKQIDLTVYTGTYGVMTLKHISTGKDVELYLYNSEGEKKIPIPKLVWKVVYHPQYNAGVALIGINNPYENEYKLDNYIICKDICNQLTWLKFDTNHTNTGYVYCCTVQDFNNRINMLPSKLHRIAKLLN